MGLFTELTGTYKCDNCGHKFDGKEVKLHPFGDGVVFKGNCFLKFVFVNKAGKLTSSYEQPKSDEMVLSCPKCNYTHLFGFKLADLSNL